MDDSPPDPSIHGISQARMLEWVAITFSRGSSWPTDWTWVSCIQADSLPSELWQDGLEDVPWDYHLTITLVKVINSSYCDKQPQIS